MKNYNYIFIALFLSLFVLSCDKEDANADKGNGTVTFWTPNLDQHAGYLHVVIDSAARNITLSWPSLPDCKSTQGTAVFNLPAGTYTYSTSDGHGAVSFGSVTVFANDCFEHKIN